MNWLSVFISCESGCVCALINSWYVYELDQCTFVTYQWSPMLRIQDVITPLPRPMQDYGQVSDTDYSVTALTARV